jgi:hypothetical protein
LLVRFNTDLYFAEVASAIILSSSSSSSSSSFLENDQFYSQELVLPNVASIVKDVNQHVWILDSGASDYMTLYKALFINFTACRIYVGLPDSYKAVTEGFGDIVLNFVNYEDGSIAEIELRRV